MIGTILQVCFGLTLVGNLLWSAALCKLLQFVPMGKRFRQGLSLMLVQVAWRLSLALAPWMWCASGKGYTENWKLVLESAKDKPVFILGNHCSFFDTVLSASVFYPSVLWRCRCYMDKALFKIPVLGTICNSIGHFPVYFASAKEGEFKTDKDKNAVVDVMCDEHLSHGGWLCFFPEGQINKNPDEIQVFRYGGMKKALTFDARLILFTAVGNTTVWPRKAQVGGLPGRVAYGAKALAPKGSKALVEELRAKMSDSEKEEAKKKCPESPEACMLAEYARDVMQKEYEDLQTQKPSGVLSFLWWCVPAVALYTAFGMGWYTVIAKFMGWGLPTIPIPSQAS